jgi:nitrite reductase (cytochrome c-552)
MTTRRSILSRATLSAVLLLLSTVLLASCGSQPAETATPPQIPAGEHDPGVWGAHHPEVYERWLATKDERPAGRSMFKRGYDGGVMYDKLSEYPFMAVLFNGWGFGIDYNEPRGHYYMLIDQQEADPARVKAGGACLTCKSSYAEDLYEQNAKKLFEATYEDAVSMLPEGQQRLGATCIDCHDNATLDIRTRRWTVDAALAEIGVDKGDMSLKQQRLMACGQCHSTYSLLKDGPKVLDVDFPWEGGEWGAITVEDIIANLESHPQRLEWGERTSPITTS